MITFYTVNVIIGICSILIQDLPKVFEHIHFPSFHPIFLPNWIENSS